jgi:hypothetical protein
LPAEPSVMIQVCAASPPVRSAARFRRGPAEGFTVTCSPMMNWCTPYRTEAAAKKTGRRRSVN